MHTRPKIFLTTITAHDAFGIHAGLHQQTAGDIGVGAQGLGRQLELTNARGAFLRIFTFTQPTPTVIMEPRSRARIPKRNIQRQPV